MNFKDQIQQIFGTTDIHELKQISRDADNYRCLNADMNNSIISEKKKNTGRKNSFTEEQLAHILALQDRGEKITDIARQYHVSRQTIYSQIKRAYNFSDDPDKTVTLSTGPNVALNTATTTPSIAPKESSSPFLSTLK